jgi:hypothetical protein
MRTTETNRQRQPLAAAGSGMPWWRAGVQHDAFRGRRFELAAKAVRTPHSPLMEVLGERFKWCR